MLSPHVSAPPAVVALCGSVVAGTTTTVAAEAGKRTFNLPRGDAAVTLKQFAAAAGTPIVYLVDRVLGATTNAVAGEFTPRETLERMLIGSGLEAAQDAATGAFVVSRKRTAEATPRTGEVGPVSDPQPKAKANSMKSPRTLLTTMKPNRLLTTLTAVVAFIVGSPADGQTVPVTAIRADAGNKEAAVVLSPFEVIADTGDAYGTTMTTSATMFRTDIDKLPVTADVMTTQFMRDLDIKDLDELVSTFATGSGWGSLQSDTDALPKEPGVRVANTEVKLRGVGSGALRRDGVISANNSAFMDGFATESIEILKGPNALMYAGAAGGGVISAVSKQARFGRNATDFSFRLDSFGSKRGELDWSRSFRTGLRLVPEIAVRTALMKQHQEFYRDGYGNDAWGAYTQVAFRLPQSTLRIGYLHSEALNWVGWSPTFSYRSSRPTIGAWDPSPDIVARHTGPDRAIPALSTSDLFAEGEGPRIANGRLTLRNLNSAFISDYNHNPKDDYLIANLETRWSRHISSLVTFATDENPVDMQYTGPGNLYPPGYINIERPSRIPYDPSTPISSYAAFERATTTDWTVVAPAPEFYEQHFRRKALRAALGAEWTNFGGKLKHNAVAGYEQTQLKTDFDWFFYYLADANWNIIVNPATVATTNTNGRTQLRNQWYEVGEQGIVFQRINSLQQKRITLNGQNWVLQSKNYPGIWPVTPANPHGLRPMTATGGSFDGHSFLNTTTAAFFGAVQTDWFDDRVQTVLSLRREEYASERWDYLTLTGFNREESNWGGNAGLNLRVASWLRPYANYSRAVALPNANSTYGPFGELVPTEKSQGLETGIKFNVLGRINGSLSYYATSIKGKNTNNNLAFDANPDGINGRTQPSARWIGVDQKTNGYELMFSGAPTPGWRTTMRVGVQDGRVGTQLGFPQVYNDEFYTDAARNVTYQNGSVVRVNPTSIQAVANGGVPLTVAMLNDRTSLYYWDPNPRTGTTQNSSLRTLLQNPGSALVTANGPIATGRNGLPSSARQIEWDDPLGFSDGIEISRAGRMTIGYPRYKLSFTNTYNFRSGWWKAFGVGGVVNLELENRSRWIRWPLAYDSRNRVIKTTDDVPAAEMPRVNLPGKWYYTNQGLLWGLPDNTTFNMWLTYTRKLGREGRYRYSSQLNVNNVFDHVPIVANPYNGTIFGETRGLVMQNQPRSWSWTNRIEF